MYRALVQAFSRHRVVLVGCGVMNIWQDLTTVKCHRCAARTEAVFKKYENEKRIVDRALFEGMTCVDNCRKRHKRDLDAAINILRQLTTSWSHM
jgi:transposase